MTISGGSALSKEDIERMTKDAEAHAEEDKKRKEAIELRNQAESLVYQTEKFLKENEDKLPADARSNVETPLSELKKTLEETANVDVLDASAQERIKSGVEAVATASQALGSALYQQQQQADDSVIDAEVVDEESAKA